MSLCKDLVAIFFSKDDKKWAVLCLCDPPASVWYFEIADPMGRYFDPEPLTMYFPFVTEKVAKIQY
jgi:hypothetical protein